MPKRVKIAIPGVVRGIPVIYTANPGVYLFPVGGDRGKFRSGRAFAVLRPSLSQLEHESRTAFERLQRGGDCNPSEQEPRCFLRDEYPVDDVVTLLQVFDKVDYFFWSMIHQCCFYLCGDSRRPNRSCSKLYHTPFYRDAVPLAYHDSRVSALYGGHDVMIVRFRPVVVGAECQLPQKPAFLPLELNPRSFLSN